MAGTLANLSTTTERLVSSQKCRFVCKIVYKPAMATSEIIACPSKKAAARAKRTLDNKTTRMKSIEERGLHEKMGKRLQAAFPLVNRYCLRSQPGQRNACPENGRVRCQARAHSIDSHIIVLENSCAPKQR